MIFYILIIFCIAIIATIALNYLVPTPEEKGRRGESAIAYSLESLVFKDINGKILRNIFIPTSENGSVEIDLLYITVKGIIVVESKNYAGFIFGNERNKNWTVTLYGGKGFLGSKKVDKYHFYNPIWQNNTHIKCLKKYLHKDLRCLSVIVFSDRGKMKNVTWNPQDTIICYTSEVNKKLRKYYEEMPDCISEEEIEKLYSLLYPLTIVSGEDKAKHIGQVNDKKYGRQPVGAEAVNKEELKCPWCGGTLKVRTAKQGPTAGSQFYGCSNYPKCRYTRNIS